MRARKSRPRGQTPRQEATGRVNFGLPGRDHVWSRWLWVDRRLRVHEADNGGPQVVSHGKKNPSVVCSSEDGGLGAAWAWTVGPSAVRG